MVVGGAGADELDEGQFACGRGGSGHGFRITKCGVERIEGRDQGELLSAGLSPKNLVDRGRGGR
jgi:hypothetical protein